jgi:hypothetical protein
MESVIYLAEATSHDGRLTKKRGLSDYVFWILLAVLVLKMLGLTKAWFNIDPAGISISFDLSSAISFGLFALLWGKFNNMADRVAKLEVKVNKT